MSAVPPAAAALALAVMACGSSRAPEPAKQARVPVEEACPATYAAATGTCRVRQWCTYAEGECGCFPPASCSGRVRSDKEQKHLTWQCTPKPPDVREDGCPGAQPGTHLACTTERKQCTYPACCPLEFTCTNGLWVKHEGECPP